MFGVLPVAVKGLNKHSPYLAPKHFMAPVTIRNLLSEFAAENLGKVNSNVPVILACAQNSQNLIG